MPRPSLQTRHARNRDTAASSPTATQRREIFTQMNEALQERVSQMELANVNAVRSSIHYYYSVGKQCREIANMGDVFGADAIALLERYFTTTGLQLRKCRQFAETYTESEMQALIDLKHDEADFHLNWGHIVVLLSLPTAADREKFAKRAIQKLWTVKDLRREVQKLRGGADVRNTGRPHKIPDTLEGQIRQIISITQTWLDKARKVWDGDAVSVFKNIERAEPEQVTDEMAKDLQTAIDSVTEVHAVAADHVQKLTDLQASLRNKLITRLARERESGTPRPRAVRVGGGD